MKTIRQNSFETNSSSTHSISFPAIAARSEYYEPIVENGVCYPERLDAYSIQLDYGEGGYTLVCDTVEKKIAWAYGAIARIGDYQREYPRFEIARLNQIVAEKTGVVLSDESVAKRGRYGMPWSRHGTDECGNGVDMEKAVEDESILVSFLEQVVLNPNRKILDEEIPH